MFRARVHAQGVEMPPLHSKKAPDPGKQCDCGRRFYRKAKETLHAYQARDQCSAKCGKDDYGETHAYAAKSEFSCVNCSWMHEDSDRGRHCGSCGGGSNFKNKHRS